MTDSQLDAMIAMHRRMERAFRAFGNVRDAEQARAKAEELEAEREQRMIDDAVDLALSHGSRNR